MDTIGSWAVERMLDPRSPQVYLCRHSATSQDSMIEVVPRSEAIEAGHRRAVDAMKVLSHPNIPAMHDFGLDGDRQAFWKAFEVHDGERMSDRLTSGPMDWRDVCNIFHQIAQALENVHSHSLVHRDLHPGRIVIAADGKAWLTGFEFSMTAEDLARLSHAPIGDMSYLSPEVISDPNHHGPRADLYALGVVLYEALTGMSAFPAATWGERADSAARMLEWKTRASALDVSEHVDVPDWLAGLVRKATDPRPHKRLPDIEALIGWLEAATPAWISNKTRFTPAPPSRQKAPPLVSSMQPSIGVKPTAIDLPPASIAAIGGNTQLPHPSTAVLERQVAQMMYAAAMILGLVSGLALSSLIVVFVELATAG